MTTNTDEAVLRIGEELEQDMIDGKVLRNDTLYSTAWMLEFARRLLAERERAEPGMMMAPREPTREMLRASHQAVVDYQSSTAMTQRNVGELHTAMYRAMLSAAPAAPIAGCAGCKAVSYCSKPYSATRSFCCFRSCVDRYTEGYGN